MQQKSEGIFPRFFCCAMMARPIRVSAAAQRRFFPAEGRFFCLMVARWDATFCSFRGIGEGGTAAPLGFFLQGPRAPAPTNARRAKPSSALHLWVGLPGPHPGFLSFHDESHQRRARGAAPGPRWGGIIIPPTAQAPLPPERVSGTDAAGFATLGLCEQLAFLSPRALLGEHPLLSNRGTGTVA